MQQLKQYYSRKEQGQLSLNILLYVLFVYFTLDLALKQEKAFDAIMYILLLVFFISFALLHEYLTFVFKKSIYALTVSANAEEAINEIQSLIKYDVFKSYAVSIFMFKCLAYLDQNQPNKVLELTQTDKLPKSSRDVVLMKNYAIFRAYVLLNNKTKMKKAYKDLIELKNIKIKGKKLSPLFSWDDIEAEYEWMMGDNKKALSHLAKSNVNVMNQREKAQHYFLLGCVYQNLNRSSEAREQFKLVQALGGNMHQVNLATQAMKDLLP
jgi:hypothetical protein